MPNSLKARLEKLKYKGIISDKDYEKLCKALEQESILDKIREEIEQIIGERNLDDYDFCSGLICARNIIDKYKAESEDKEMNDQTLKDIDRAFKALTERDELLDQIRADIEKLQKMCDKNDLNLLAQYSAFGMALDIIDKYKAESEKL